MHAVTIQSQHRTIALGPSTTGSNPPTLEVKALVGGGPYRNPAFDISNFDWGKNVCGGNHLGFRVVIHAMNGRLFSTRQSNWRIRMSQYREWLSIPMTRLRTFGLLTRSGTIGISTSRQTLNIQT